MTISRTMIAGIPVAAWTVRPPSPNMPITHTAANHVATEAASASTPPIATGLR